MKTTQLPNFLLLVLFSVCAGCSPFQAKKDPTKYYVLTAKSTERLSTGPKIAVGVGPVTIPGYLQRDEIAIAGAASSLELAEFHVWAESLEKAVAHVVAKNMSGLLNSPAVVPFPDADTKIDYQAGIVVRRFEMGADQKVHLQVSYLIDRVPGSDGKATSRSRDLVIDVVDPTSYDAIVDAMSRALASLSSSIARDVLSMNRSR